MGEQESLHMERQVGGQIPEGLLVVRLALDFML